MFESNRKTLLSGGVFAYFCGIAGCSRHPLPVVSSYKPLYTEEDVRSFVVPGTDISAVISRFGPPLIEEKNPKFDDGSTAVDQIDSFELPMPPKGIKEDFAYAGFQAFLKNGKVVIVRSIHRDVH